jgi:DNA-binding transcriptional regulator YbjK
MFTVRSIATPRYFYKELDNLMNRAFNILTRTESAVTAVCASLLSVVTVGAVIALFATSAPVESVDRVVLEPVVITATKSA